MEHRKLSEIADICKGKQVSRKQLEFSNRGPESDPCVKNGDITKHLPLRFTECVNWIRRDYIRNPVRMQRFDILMTSMGAIKSIGRCCQYLGDGDPIIGVDIIRIRARPDIVDPNYLLYALDSPNIRKQILRIIYFSTVCHIKYPKLPDLLIPLPPLETQRTIVQAIEKIDTTLAENALLMQELTLKAKTYRKDVMTALFPRCS